MLRNASRIKGYAIAASDGDIGTVSDLLFDDQSWLIRWLVVETGDWLTRRRVLLPTSTLGHANEQRREFSVKLTMRQVENSPDIDTERPVSRQMENNIYGYYGWSPYWGSGLYMGGYGYGSILNTAGLLAGPEMGRSEEERFEAQPRQDDPHLRSISAVDGYHVHATDGGIGHVEDMLIEEADWSIHHLVVDTKNWWPSRKVLISPRLANDVDWAGRSVTLSIDREAVKNSPLYDTETIVDRDDESQSGTYYNEPDAGTIRRPHSLNGLHL